MLKYPLYYLGDIFMLEGNYDHSDDDQIDAQVEYNLKKALAKQKAEAIKSQVTATGFCNYCQAPVDDDMKFCDHECRDDYEYEQQRKRVNGF